MKKPRSLVARIWSERAVRIFISTSAYSGESDRLCSSPGSFSRSNSISAGWALNVCAQSGLVLCPPKTSLSHALFRRHAPLVVIAQGKLTVGYVAADVFETSVGCSTYRHEVMQLVGRQCELDFTLFIGRVLPEQCLSLHVFGRFYACKTKYGRSQVCEVDQRIIFAGCLFSRQVLPLGREVSYQGHFQTVFHTDSLCRVERNRRGR